MLVRLVVQRVISASVRVDDLIVGSIEGGYLLLVGVEPEDTETEVAVAASKLGRLRLFGDDLGKMNLDVGTVDGEILVVSQFTLLADSRKGRRPSFTGAASPDHAEQIIGLLVKRLAEMGIPTSTGVFGARMEVSLVNDGPVTLVLDIREGRLV